MRLSKSWIVARKDFSIFRSRRFTVYGLVALPMVLSVGLPLLLWFIDVRRGLPPAVLPVLMQAFSFFFVAWASVLPVGLASYSFVGEKVEKSLEPLLATPTTDEELLVGKILASFVPCVAALGLGEAVYMVLADAITVGPLGYVFYPNWGMAVIVLLVALATLLGVSLNVLISSRVTDVRAATQLGALAALPFGVIYVSFETNLLAFTTDNLVLIAGALALADAAGIFASRATFRREEILTKWK